MIIDYKEFKAYKPASVLVIDLCKHSSLKKKDIYIIQNIMEEVISEAIKFLKLNEAYFNYIGDGYFCTLLGDSCTKILDFINSIFPKLYKRFKPYNQNYRAGLDFGLVHLQLNPITGKEEYFDLPGIRASRLESAAAINQILCTETVFSIFACHYPDMFSKESISINTKDQKITAYQINYVDPANIQQLFTDYFFDKIELENIHIGDRNKILIVDDDVVFISSIKQILSNISTKYEIITASNAREALSLFKNGEFALVLTDIVMPGMDGIELTEIMTKEDPGIIVIMMSGYYSKEIAKKFFRAGGLIGIAKPFAPAQLNSLVQFALSFGTPLAFQGKLSIFCDMPEKFLILIPEIYRTIHYILINLDDKNDIAQGLLRHKAKHIIKEFVENLKPGSDIIFLMQGAYTQLQYIEKITRPISKIKIKEFESFIVQMINDLKQINPNVNFKFRSSISSSTDMMPIVSTIVLIIYELIDNSLSAIKGEGNIGIKLDFLETTGMVNIVVSDNGPGVSKDILEKMFIEGISTKGPGRGLGLSLISEVSKVFSGKISYQYDNGAVFHVTLFPFS